MALRRGPSRFSSSNADGLRVLIPVVLALVAAYFLFVPSAHQPPAEPRMSERTYRAAVIPAIGAYDGAFGPGTGSAACAVGRRAEGAHPG